MSKEQFSTAELQDKYPELYRAWQLYIQLFKDSTPLINLGYTKRQQEQAIMALSLMENGGSIGEDSRHHWAAWTHPKEPETKTIVTKYNDVRAYYLMAYRVPNVPDDFKGDLKYIYLSQTEGFPEILGVNNSCVANMCLIDNQEETSDLNSLIPLIYKIHRHSIYPRLAKENPLTKMTKKVGINSVYQASWADGHQHEFAIKVERFGKNTHYDIWRKLSTIQDQSGNIVPFGKKANVSPDKVEQILQANKEKVIRGQLAMNPNY